jgi:ribosome maturation factor RimP
MSLAELKQKIEESIGPILALRNAFLVDLQVRQERGGKLVQAFVDTDEGITIDLCAAISRDLNRNLALDRVIEGPYNLEVSSPGIDRPLKLLRQYRKNIGRRYKVKYRQDSEHQTLTGILTAVSDDRLTFKSDVGEELTLSFSQVIESKEELPW